MDFDKTVSEAHLSAAGWELGGFNHSSPFESHFIYVRDFDHDDVRLFSVLQSHLDSVPVLDIPSSTLADELAKSLSALRAGAIAAGDDPTFLPLLLAYVKSTQSYSVWRQLGCTKLHYILNVYGSGSGPKNTRLRPFVVTIDDVVLPAAHMMSYSSDVLDMDRTKFPEWF